MKPTYSFQHFPGLVLRITVLVLLIVTQGGCDNRDATKTIDFSQVDEEQSYQADNSAQQGNVGEVYFFGFDLRSSIEEDARQYQPLLTYLSDVTGYNFKLVLTTENDRLDEKLGKGEIHFAAIGAVSHIKAQQRYGVIPVVRGLNAIDRGEYQSVIVTDAQSDILNVQDLRGKRFAFGNRDSTQGHLIPRIDLLDHGISIDDFWEYTYTGSHRNCANAVISGQYDACGMQDTMGKELESQGLVQIIHYSAFYPASGISAYAGLSADVVNKVRQALVNFDPRGRHAGMLYNWGKTEMPNGFQIAMGEDYARLSEWMDKLGF